MVKYLKLLCDYYAYVMLYFSLNCCPYVNITWIVYINEAPNPIVVLNKHSSPTYAKQLLIMN